MAWFDIGVNLTNSRFSADLDLVIERARQKQVNQLLITGTDVQESRAALQLAEQYQLVSTAGVHPHYAGAVEQDYLLRLRELASADRVRAIGECGLDFNRNFSSKEDQLRVFEQQLELAADLQKPVFLHERDAFPEQITLLKQYRDKLSGGVAHCFTGDRMQMEAYLELDLHIGITGWLCDERRAQPLREAVTALPLSRVLLETDAPYLAPRHIRPRIERCEPCHLPIVAEELASLMNIPVAELAKQSFANSLALFEPEKSHDNP
ncbi:TatD family hydrolase [Bowmanella sp. Y26]|uniref:TatD family hydrolase n=1 Tax=Bowmanella yangjiangensis TaxID=2811230 RepID=UPI001BDBFAAC|nr:TatD family hydrolase [Bowmanella yangjiangensis]MBT1064154.1 TatD family hydrolase [Bowmanella yangjiangensis]